MSSDEETETQSWKGLPGSVILINILDETATTALKATCQMVRHCLRLASSQLIGVCLYGIDNSSSTSFKSVVEIFPLKTPTLDDYKNLINIDLTSYTQSKELKMSEALWYSSKQFASCKKFISSRTVIIPIKLQLAPTVSDQKPTFKRVVELLESNININVINLSSDEYKIHQFYEKFLKEANKGKEVILPKPIWEINDISESIYKHIHRHLAVARLEFEIGENVAIGVGLYSLLKKQQQAEHKKVDLDQESNEIVSSVTKTMKMQINNDINSCEEDDLKEMAVLKSELLHYQVYCGEKIEFSDNEMKMIKNPFGPPKLKLLGFKPKGVLSKEKWFLKPGYFLFPNESSIEGSTVAFKALYVACIEMNVVAICVLCARVNSKPSIVALSPCTHPLGLDAEIGFDVIIIPFAENLRHLPNFEDECSDAIPHDKKKIMKDIINETVFDFEPNMFENPKLQCTYRAIEAIALQEENIEPFIDTTIPDESKFKNVKADLFEATFGPFGIAVSGFDKENLKLNIRNKTVHKYNVAQLKDILKSYSNPSIPALTGLKKDALVSLVYQYSE